VHKRSGADDQRKVLTTRRDGAIRVEIGQNGERPYLSVTVN
jgi:hypothetical protein